MEELCAVGFDGDSGSNSGDGNGDDGDVDGDDSRRWRCGWMEMWNGDDGDVDGDDGDVDGDDGDVDGDDSPSMSSSWSPPSTKEPDGKRRRIDF